LLRWVDKYNENCEIKRHNIKPVAYEVYIRLDDDKEKENKIIKKVAKEVMVEKE